MTFLAWVFVVKIAGSIVGLVIPFLLFSEARLSQLAGVAVSRPMARLYGMAIVALLIGYGFGLAEHVRGGVPTGSVWMGLVSNGGGAAIAAIHLHGLPRLLGAGFFGGIALCLAAVLIASAARAAGGTG